MRFLILASACILAVGACTNSDDSADVDTSVIPENFVSEAPQALQYRVVASHPHDTSAYTQGLEIFNGKMYEGTGDYDQSSLRVTDYKTGKVIQKHMMGDANVFGEGITIFKNKIYQLTWQSNKVYVYDVANIDKPVQTLNWPYEGWGITHNDSMLIVSDGSANLYWVDPATFKVQNKVSVRDNQGEVPYLNELEWVNGFIYANVYQTNRIVKIEPETGKVIGDMFIKDLLAPEETVQGRTDVLNGIAYDSASKTFLITGKRYPKLFEVKID